LENRLYATYCGIIRDTPDNIFSLCCPTREEEWIDGWNDRTYKLLCSESGFNEKHCVFEEYSLKPFLFGKQGPTTWITTSFEPERFSLEFMLVFGDTAVMNRRIRVEKLSEDSVSACYWADVVSFLEDPPTGIKRIIFKAKLDVFSHNLGYLLKYYSEKGRMLTIPRPLKRVLLRSIEHSEEHLLSEDHSNLITKESIEALVLRYSGLI
jgi:hypothetical protein